MLDYDLSIRVEETALLVVDMQNGFCHPSGTVGRGKDISLMQAAVPNVEQLVTACRKAHIPDIWTVQEHYLDDHARISHRILPHALRNKRGPAAVTRTWDSAILDELQPYITQETELIRKHRFSAFFDTRLDTLLRILGIKLLVICGVSTTLCVETTVRDAYQRDYDVVVVEDAVGMSSRELHEASLEVMRRYFGVILSTYEVCALIENPAETCRIRF